MQGRWDVRGHKAKVWVDTNSLALGVAFEINERVIKDAIWLHKEDSCHINIVELDAVIKDLNLALAWKIKKVN